MTRALQRPIRTQFAALAVAAGLAAAAPGVLAHNDKPEQPTIQTTGVGEAIAAPDRAWVQLGVESTSKTLAAAQSDVDDSVQRFLKLTDELGIARKHVQSAQLSVSPQYEWTDKPRTRNLVGYRVSRGLTVDLRDLDLLGSLLTRALKLGVNQSSGPRFDHTDRDALHRQALALATVDAHTQAQTMASALGVGLGPALELSAHGQSQPRPVQAMAMRMASDESSGAEQSYEAGQIVVRAQVSAKFAMR